MLFFDFMLFFHFSSPHWNPPTRVARVDAQEANSATQRERITSLEAATQRMQEQHATTAEQVQTRKMTS